MLWPDAKFNGNVIRIKNKNSCTSIWFVTAWWWTCYAGCGIWVLFNLWILVASESSGTGRRGFYFCWWRLGKTGVYQLVSYLFLWIHAQLVGRWDQTSLYPQLFCIPNVYVSQPTTYTRCLAHTLFWKELIKFTHTLSYYLQLSFQRMNKLTCLTCHYMYIDHSVHCLMLAQNYYLHK